MRLGQPHPRDHWEAAPLALQTGPRRRRGSRAPGAPPAHPPAPAIPPQGPLLLALAAGAALLARLSARRAPAVRLLDFAVHRPPDAWRLPRDGLIEVSEGVFSPEDIAFQHKVIHRSGLGDATCVTPAIVARVTGMAVAREEFELVCFSAVQDLLTKTGVDPKRIRFLVTNSSLFNPTPSLGAMIMNRFKMGPKTQNYALGGMGCSAGVIALDLAQQLLERNPGELCLVVSHENITNAHYKGADRAMQVSNCIFRCNGAAMLLSSRPADAARAKYDLRHVVRTNLAADDQAYGCVMQMDDDEGKWGVHLGKELMAVAARALRANMTSLGPRVLPLSEQLRFAASLAARRLAGASKAAAAALPHGWARPYTPDFKRAFEHMCIHTGGRGVIDTIEKELALPLKYVEPSRAALYQFGNTSSTSIWYILAYLEHHGRVAKGDRVWQLGFGSGFKCNSAVWVAARRIESRHHAWEGFDVQKMVRRGSLPSCMIYNWAGARLLLWHPPRSAPAPALLDTQRSPPLPACHTPCPPPRSPALIQSTPPHTPAPHPRQYADLAAMDRKLQAERDARRLAAAAAH
ncbi:MAG: FAE1/Type III polyketide synthase-like protein-domain-containing protein [Monoraphidium minutum]|nr:MAG: FAE1/Type III polyketide synthase-like protein-domain-containing protein [Monoraphidium minutum]